MRKLVHTLIMSYYCLMFLYYKRKISRATKKFVVEHRKLSLEAASIAGTILDKDIRHKCYDRIQANIDKAAEFIKEGKIYD